MLIVTPILLSVSVTKPILMLIVHVDVYMGPFMIMVLDVNVKIIIMGTHTLHERYVSIIISYHSIAYHPTDNGHPLDMICECVNK
jgi:hypothetical protein